MTLNIILMTIAVLAIIYSLFLLLDPEWSQKTARKMVKTVKRMKKIGTIGIIIGIILF